MIRTDYELADKIVYLKKNNYMPNIDDEMPDVQRAIQSFYNCSKSTIKKHDDIISSMPKKDRDEFMKELDDDPFWFRITFQEYQVSDDFVKEVNRAYKKFLIRNIGKSEFEPNVN